MSIRARLRAVSTMFRWAEDWRSLSENPAPRTRPPKVPKIRKPFLKPVAFDSLIELCPLNTMAGPRPQAMSWFLITRRVRRRELSFI